MIRFYSVLIIIFALSISAYSQQQNEFYKQFLFNPFLYNPAYVGINNSPEINIAYRQQWANFKDAPVSAAMTFQVPMSSRIAMGITLNSNRQVLLSNNSFKITFGYILPISKQQSLRFGISGGLGLNKLDMTVEEMNSPDLVLHNSVSNNMYIDGNFGMVYSLGALRLGFSFPKLFHSNAFSTANFNGFEVSNLKNRLYSASYKFYFRSNKRFALEPYALYRQTDDRKQNYWELATMAHFKEVFWTGVSFNQHNSIAIFTGINVKNRFRLSYGYEFPPLRSSIVKTNSHEIQLAIRFNKKKTSTLAQTPKPTMIHLTNGLKTEIRQKKSPKDLGNLNPRMPNPDNTINFDFGSESREHKVVAKKEDLKEAERKTPFTESKVLKHANPPKAHETFTVTTGHHYVVVAVFGVMSHSMKFTKRMIQKGHIVNVILNPKNGFYYAYIYSSTNLGATKRFRNDYKFRNLFKDAWVFTPQE
ncbi:MAG: PorP/SprF family type IX secretion system membrane protein [Chryseolinea sp.]